MWVNEYGNANYSLEVWKMILKFADFRETYKPKLIHSEIHLFSDVHKIAGTCDLVLEIDGKIWLLDIKTSNNLHTSYILFVFPMFYNNSNVSLLIMLLIYIFIYFFIIFFILNMFITILLKIIIKIIETPNFK